MVAFMSLDTAYFRPLELSDAMPDMNWVTSGREITWILRDAQTGQENMDIHWHFRQGDVVKIRIHNEGKGRSFHPMSHPIHFHGQRLLVLRARQRPVPSSVTGYGDASLRMAGKSSSHCCPNV